MKTYLTNLLIEKGITNDIQNPMPIDGHFGLTYEMQIDFICSTDAATQSKIKDNFIKIDFKDGDIMHFWDYITNGMLESCGY